MRHDLYYVINKTRGNLICNRARIADGFLTRLVGLLGSGGLQPGEGLWITPSSGVHTFGMAFPIDIVAMDGHCRITAIREEMEPWRLGGLNLKTKSILELPAGQSRRSQIAVGDELCFALATDGATD